MELQPLKIFCKNTFIIMVKSTDYQFKDGDKLFFTVKPEPIFEKPSTDDTAVINKTWTVGTDASVDENGYLELELTPDDTDVAFGCYYYDIKLVNADVSQTIVMSKLKILPVTTLED